MKFLSRVWRWSLLVVLAIAGPVCGTYGAAPSEPVNSTGTWKWTLAVPGSPAIEPSIALRQQGEKRAGTPARHGFRIWFEVRRPDA